MIQMNRYAVISATLAMWLIVTGCNHNSNDQLDIVAANNELIRELEDLYLLYLSQNALEARNALLEQVFLVEDAEWLSPRDKANILILVYSRLYFLNCRTGEEVLAEAAWINFRYWNLKRFELGGMSTETAMEESSTFTVKRMAEIIDSQDREANRGNLPKYYAK